MKTLSSLLHPARLAGVLAFTLVPPAAQAITTIPFGNASELADNFTIFQPQVAQGTYQWTGSAGVGSPLGAVVRTSNSGSADSPAMFYTGSTYNPVIGDEPLQISIYFQAVAATTSNTSRIFAGFASGTATNLSSSTNKLGIRVFKDTSTGAGSNFVLQLQNGTSNTTAAGPFNLTTDNWYKLTLDVVRTAGTGSGTGNVFSLSGQLQDYGADGTSTPVLVNSVSATSLTNNNLGTAWRAGAMIQNAAGGASALDNFSVGVIPEPNTFFLVILPVIAALLCRRARSRRSRLPASGAILLALLSPGPAVRAAEDRMVDRTFDFSDPGEMSALILENYTQDSEPGLRGEPGLLLSLNEGHQHEGVYYPEASLDLDNQNISLSVCFKADGANEPGQVRIFLGLAGGADVNLSESDNKIGFRIFKDQDPRFPELPWVFQLVNGVATRNLGERFTLKDGQWYGIRVAFSRGEQDVIDCEGEFGEVDDDGKMGVAVAADIGTTKPQPTYDPSRMIAAFLGQRNGGGAVAFDDFRISARAR